MVDHQRLGDDVEDRVLGVDGVVGVLEDDLAVTPVVADGARREAADLEALVDDLAAGLGFEAQKGAAGGGLAAARLADQGEDLAGADGEAHPVDGPHPVLLGGDHRLEERLAHREEDLETTDVVEVLARDGGVAQVLAADRARLDLLLFEGDVALQGGACAGLIHLGHLLTADEVSGLDLDHVLIVFDARGVAFGAARVEAAARRRV